MSKRTVLELKIDIDTMQASVPDPQLSWASASSSLRAEIGLVDLGAGTMKRSLGRVFASADAAFVGLAVQARHGEDD